MSSSRRNNGRQKIEMKKMANKSNLQVTFSKRRNGLFKKASELCTLCAVEVALIVFSPGAKFFSFGHPNVEALLHRYLTGAPPHASSTMQFLEAQRNANVRELNVQLTDLTNEFEAEKKRAEELNKLRKASQAEMWWAAPIDEMNIPQLNRFNFALQQLKKAVACQSDHVLIQSPPSFAASSSTLPSQKLQNDNRGFDLNVMDHYGFNNMGGYGPGAGF